VKLAAAATAVAALLVFPPRPVVAQPASSPDAPVAEEKAAKPAVKTVQKKPGPKTKAATAAKAKAKAKPRPKAKPKPKRKSKPKPKPKPAVTPPPAAPPPAAPVPAPKARLSEPEAAARYEHGLVLEGRGDEPAAFQAFLEAAESGHGLAQRRLGELYDKGNSAVPRDYESSLRWYQKAREQGVPIAKPVTFPKGH
jgi:outer membrane biosynthesis protein TonB